MGKKFTAKKVGFLITEERAQAGVVFRLMVDAIMGIAILLIILSALSYFNDLRMKTSLTEFNSLITAAVNAPDGKIVSSNDLIFAKGLGFQSQTLETATGVPKECFRFSTNLASIDVGNGSHAEMKQNVETKVYTQCVPAEREPAYCSDSSGAASCEICCLISFGKELK